MCLTIAGTDCKSALTNGKYKKRKFCFNDLLCVLLLQARIANPRDRVKSALEAVHGDSREWVETSYNSLLLDGSIVKIKHVNHHRYNLQAIFENHYTYFEIQ